MTTEIKKCPFCEGEGVLKKKTAENPNEGYSGTDFFVVECSTCRATGKHIVIKYMREFNDFTVEDYRKDPALRAREEDKYETYLKEHGEKAIAKWNTRVN